MENSTTNIASTGICGNLRTLLYYLLLLRSLMVMSATLNRVEAFHTVHLSYDLSAAVV